MFEKTADSTRKNFIKYLDAIGISAKSHKNYRSDLNHFVEWIILRLRSFGSYVDNLTGAVPFLNREVVKDYYEYLLNNNIPAKTVNRRFSTLRHLARFLLSQNIIESNFMDDIENISLQNNKTASRKSNIEPVIEDFRSFLASKSASKNTVKNYISDVRHFLTWLESNREVFNS